MLQMDKIDIQRLNKLPIKQASEQAVAASSWRLSLELDQFSTCPDLLHRLLGRPASYNHFRNLLLLVSPYHTEAVT
jgi:hypothetical protein